MMKKKILLSLFIFSLLTLQGCWDYTEYENMVQVVALGVDYNVDSNEVTGSIQYIPTTEESSQGSPVNGVVYSETDPTLFGALAKLRECTFKDLFWGYTKIVVIGEEAAKYKMKDILAHFNRGPAVRDTAYLVITQGKAVDTLSTSDVDQIASSGEQIYNLVDLSQDAGAAFPVSTHEFITMLAIAGIEATAPRVITLNSKQQEEKKQGAQRISGIAAFKKDKLVGWLDEKESLGFLWITGKDPNVYKVSETSAGTDTQDILYYHIDSSKSKIKAQIVNGEPVINIEVKVNAELRKYYTNNGSNMLLSKEIDDMEKKLSESVRSDIEAALKRSQRELQSDIFGFGFAFYRKDTKLWQTELERNWDDIYPNMEVNVNIDAKVQNTEKTIRKLIVK